MRSFDELIATAIENDKIINYRLSTQSDGEPEVCHLQGILWVIWPLLIIMPETVAWKFVIKRCS